MLGRLRKKCPMILEKFREGPRSKDVAAVREYPWRRQYLRCITKGEEDLLWQREWCPQGEEH